MATESVTLAPRDIERVEILLRKIRGVAQIMSTADDPVCWEDVKWIASDLSEKCTDALEVLAGETED